MYPAICKRICSEHVEHEEEQPKDALGEATLRPNLVKAWLRDVANKFAAFELLFSSSCAYDFLSKRKGFFMR